jgi:hypothetical protein
MTNIRLVICMRIVSCQQMSPGRQERGAERLTPHAKNGKYGVKAAGHLHLPDSSWNLPANPVDR